jgi:DNA-binding IscR family transcriptional regulator
MNINEVRKIAKGMDINTYRMNKPDIIRAVQRSENNIECFGTARIEYCNEDTCLWRNDCLSINNRSKIH